MSTRNLEHGRSSQVVRCDPLSVIRGVLHWTVSLLSSGWLAAPPRSLLDTSPLRDLLQRVIPLERIPDGIEQGPLDALAVATTSYSTGCAVAFFEARPGIAEWHRARRAGTRRPMDFEVLMASAAIPFFFPASRIDGDYYDDGAMRQLAPLSPAVHLGANRLLVVGTRADADAALTPADSGMHESYLRRCASVFASAMSLTAANSRCGRSSVMKR